MNFTKRIIYKCKKCQEVWAFDYTEVKLVPTGRYTNRRELYRTNEVGKTCGTRGDCICPNCQSSRFVNYNEVMGYETEHVCDARCMGAIGKTCECACGGKNHGKNFLPQNKQAKLF